MSESAVDATEGVGPERELVDGLLRGDPRAFTRFADDYLPALQRFARRRVADPDVAREVVQNTLVQVLRHLDGFRGDSVLMTWICACCRNQIAAHFRSDQRNAQRVDLLAGQQLDELAARPGGSHDATQPEAALLAREQQERVHDALDSIAPHHARALEWMYIERLPVIEIARRLGLSGKAAESLLTRARLAFRVAYLHPGEVDSDDVRRVAEQGAHSAPSQRGRPE